MLRQPKRDAKIVIIGAGIAGLSSAERLLSSGCQNVVILEASNRIGGRIATKPVGQGWVELGAQWIHGEQGNAVYEYALKHDLIEKNRGQVDFKDMQFFTEDGHAVDDTLSSKMFQTFSNKIAECRRERRAQTLKMSVEEYLDLAFGEVFKFCESVKELELSRAMFAWLKLFQCSIDGCDSLSYMSVKALQGYRECEGNSLINFRRGYQSLVDTMAKPIPPQSIHLNKCVVKIQVPNPKGPGPSVEAVKLICKDGAEYAADHVIVTVPLGVLKKEAAAMFEPPLPEEKLSAIQKLGFGTVDKIFLEFESAFWPAATSGYSLIWKEKSPSTKPWYRDIFGFYAVPYAPNVLCGWISGAEARHMEGVADRDIQDTCLKLLQTFTGRADLPRVKSFYRSSWHDNPFSRGSYSFLTTEVSGNAAMAEPVYAIIEGKQLPVLLFAGEATHPHYYSTVHGAMETGWREADRLVEFLASNTSKL